MRSGRGGRFELSLLFYFFRAHTPIQAMNCPCAVANPPAPWAVS